MSFFEEFPEPLLPAERPEPVHQPWFGPPPGWLGGWVPWRILLGRSETAYAVLRDFEAFPTGLSFTLVSCFKDPRALDRRPGGGPPPFFGHSRGPRFGVGFADGRKAVAGSMPHQADAGDSDHPILRSGGGGGSGGTWRMSFWLWPLPPRGPLEWAAQWAEEGFAEHSTSVDATVLTVAASDAEQLWAVEPGGTARLSEEPATTIIPFQFGQAGAGPPPERDGS
jgi:hypothetical protein